MKYPLTLLPFAIVIALSVSAQRIPLINSQEVIKKADVLQDSGRYGLAIKELLTIPARDTNYVVGQTLLAVLYRLDDKLDESIAAADFVLSRKSEYGAAMIAAKASAYDAKKDYDKAMSVLQDGLKKYPFDVQIRFQIATTYHNTRQYEKAVEAYYDVLEIYPYSALTHLNLGALAVWVGQKTHAMLTLGMYMSLKEHDNGKLRYLEALAGNAVDDEGKGAMDKPLPNAFERLDQILMSKISMDKKFKTQVDIDAATVKQFEMLFQQLNTASTSENDPWLKFYGPIYSQIRDKKMIPTFINHILTSSTLESVKKWNSKNQKSRENFYQLLRDQLTRDRANINIPAHLGMSGNITAQYNNDNRLYSIGPIVNNQPQGYWIYWNANGPKSAEGNFNNGKKTGVWKYYSTDEVLTNVENEETGEVLLLYPDGSKRVEYIQKNDQVQGAIIFYYPCGAISEKREHRDGKRWGKGQLFFENGNVKADFEYVDDKLLSWIDYDIYGKIMSKTLYKDGLLEGVKEVYWPNGKLRRRETYAADKAIGDTEGFHDNGKPEYKGKFADNMPVGEWKYYDRAGELYERRWFTDGEDDKEWIQYYEGRVNAKFAYNKGKLIQAQFFDSSGKELAKSGSPDGNFEAKFYYPSGELRWVGKLKDGQRDGKWTQYYREGNVLTVYNYVEGEFEGEQIDYHPNGKKKIVSTYSKGIRDGYVEEFYSTGQLSRAGWTIDGQQQQQWISYYRDGSRLDDYWLLNGEYVDTAYLYSVEGKMQSKMFYSKDELAMEEDFDEKGRTFFIDQKTNGEQKILFSDGTTMSKYSVKCGQTNGSHERFYADGTTYVRYSSVNGVRTGKYEGFDEEGNQDLLGDYHAGKRTGIWKVYNEAGKRDQVAYYVNGTLDSTRTNYYEFGTAVYNTVQYWAGERNGLVQYFAPNGQPVVDKKYNEDFAVAVRTTDKNGKFSDWTPVSPKMAITAYYANGQKAYEEEYINGAISGVKRIYFPDGKLCKEYHYVEGENEGSFVDYYPNGKVCMKGQYRRGELDGVVEIFLENGTPYKTITYKLGTKSGPTTLFMKGVKSKEVLYFDGIPTK
jgi:antitoxin component YwqK of YwqJK toxin-antitoxin module